MRRAPAGSFAVEAEVPFHDCDPLGVVWHGHYYKYAEIGRTAFLRAKGLDFGAPSMAGLGTYVVESKCRYTFPLRYGDRFRVLSWVDESANRIVVGFEIVNVTRDRPSATGYVALASVDAEGALLLETPDAIRRQLE
jgi:acyl-CoA thioester hydrolase